MRLHLVCYRKVLCPSWRGLLHTHLSREFLPKHCLSVCLSIKQSTCLSAFLPFIFPVCLTVPLTTFFFIAFISFFTMFGICQKIKLSQSSSYRSTCTYSDKPLISRQQTAAWVLKFPISWYHARSWKSPLTTVFTTICWSRQQPWHGNGAFRACIA